MLETITSIKPLLASLVSLAAVPLIVMAGRRRPNLREGFTFAAGLIKFALVVSMVGVILDGKVIEYSLVEVLPGLAISFRVDGFGMLFALIASSLWLATSALPMPATHRRMTCSTSS